MHSPSPLRLGRHAIVIGARGDTIDVTYINDNSTQRGLSVRSIRAFITVMKVFDRVADKEGTNRLAEVIMEQKRIEAQARLAVRVVRIARHTKLTLVLQQQQCPTAVHV